MNIKLSLLKTSVGDSIQINTVLNPYKGDFGYTDDIVVKGEIKNNAGRLELYVNVDSVYHTECARCLEDVSFEVSYQYEDRIVFEETDEYISLSGDDFNLEEYVYEELALSLPFRVLCDDYCKGLCPKCGVNLNLSDCECDKEEIDPRWSALKELLNKKEE